MGKKRERSSNSSSHFDFLEPIHTSSSSSSSNHLFPQMLAASARISTNHAQTVLKDLQKLHLNLIRETPKIPYTLEQVLPNGLIALLPLLLLHISHSNVAVRSAEIVGAAALWSFEANVKLASDRGITDGLVAMLASKVKRVVVAACNAIMDLSTTSIGRERLQESFALQKLLSKDGFRKDTFLYLVLDAVLMLINTCNLEQLAKIPDGQARTALCYLKELWAKFLASEVIDCQEKISIYNYTKTFDLAETIFKLSMVRSHSTTCTIDVVRRSMFGGKLSNFELFMVNNWEDLPLLLRRAPLVMDDNDIISFLVRSLSSKTIDAFLGSILQGLVSCPPIESDELDILGFLKDIKGELGCPIKYGQDIRVLKVVNELKKEVHFFNEITCSSSTESNSFINVDHARDCIEAYHKGYTIAIRGMEFRSEKIAVIADSLAMLFGQPSVGANIYLTPPKSQGLARHCDDHCVFVCQLLGHKKWAVGPRLTCLLPRLYENFSSLYGSEGRIKGFLLAEGDILYIPRGCPHEAHTIVSEDSESDTDGSTGFSLHLTLGIEVEPPFEWEGFFHVALHYWNQKQKQKASHQFSSTLRIPHIMSVNLLHVAIRLIGDHDSTFRKACMVAGFSLLPDNGGETERHKHNLNRNQKETFIYIINKINTRSSFLKAFETVEAAINEKNRASLQWMRWLRHLPQSGDTKEKTDWSNPLEAFKDIVTLSDGMMGEAEKAFVETKSGFCREVVFEEVCEGFEMLLEKYRKVRRQYMNGMLSLHSTW